MSKPKIAIIVSSTRPTRFADIPTKWIAEKAAAHGGVDTEVVDLRDYPMPFFDEVASNAWAPTQNPVAVAWQKKLAEFDGYIFVVAEYNRSVTGVLKNALDHASRPYGQSAWGGKPAGVVGVSVGAIGTALAQQHLRNILAYLDVPTLGQPEAFIQAKDGLFDEAGNIGEGSQKFLQGWVDKYVAWVKKHV